MQVFYFLEKLFLFFLILGISSCNFGQELELIQLLNVEGDSVWVHPDSIFFCTDSISGRTYYSNMGVDGGSIKLSPNKTFAVSFGWDIVGSFHNAGNYVVYPDYVVLKDTLAYSISWNGMFSADMADPIPEGLNLKLSDSEVFLLSDLEVDTLYIHPYKNDLYLDPVSIDSLKQRNQEGGYDFPPAYAPGGKYWYWYYK